GGLTLDALAEIGVDFRGGWPLLDRDGLQLVCSIEALKEHIRHRSAPCTRAFEREAHCTIRADRAQRARSVGPEAGDEPAHERCALLVELVCHLRGPGREQ